MTDVLKLLPPPSWRGIQYPCAERKVSFRHEGAIHTIQYRDGDFVEMLGAHGLTFAYTFPMRESIAKGPYKKLFDVGLPQLFRDALNREAGELFDPIYGSFRCVPQLFDDTTDVMKRCGTDVRVEFLYSPELSDEDPALRDLSGVAGIASEAGKLDEEVAKANWAQEERPEPTQDVLLAADGVINQGLAQIDKFSAALDDFAFKLEKIENTCDRAENPQNWSIRDSARRNREAAIRTKRRLSENPATKLRQFVTRGAKLVSVLAKDVGMTAEELLRLNPGLARQPYVPAGQVVIVRAAPQRAA